ncbi:MAG: hypothetical protein JO029_07600 [Candidatus Eremiobacteraeota bacterium]|nr:hypothetical protein [Candidatus Eremiobacteraeota bacterium]
MRTAAQAGMPTVAELDSVSRAAGNRIDIAERIGRSIFATTWSAQVSQISANEIGKHLLIGIRVWGVKFHNPMTRPEFDAEVAALVSRAFAAAPEAEEIDLWASVPIEVGKGVVVSGDLAKPTTRTVYSTSVRRGQKPQAPYWDQDWARVAFKSGP